MSTCLQDCHRRLKHKLGSEVKNSGKQPPSRKPCFSKLKRRQFLFKTPNLCFLRDSYTSKIMLGTKNVRYGGTFKASKKIYYMTHILKTTLAESLSPLF